MEMAQYVLNGLIAAAKMCLVGSGLCIIWRARRFIHIGHAGILAVCPYVALAVARTGLPPGCAVCAAIVVGVCLGVGLEMLVFRPLGRSRGSGLVLFIASLGFLLVAEGSLSLAFGPDVQSLSGSSVVPGSSILGARVTSVQSGILVCTPLCLLCTWSVLRLTRLGRQITAVSCNRELAETVGIGIHRVYLCAMGLGSLLAGIAGIFIAYDTAVSPEMGLQPFLMAIVAVVIGGGTLGGTVLGACFIGMTLHLCSIWIPLRLQEPLLFIILLAFLFLRPQGFLGGKTKKATG